MVQRRPKGHPLPHHAAAKGAVGTADDPVGLEEEARADGVGGRGHQGGAALEAGDGVLLDGERVQLRAEAELGLFPRVHGLVLGGKVGFPEGDVAHAADAEHGDQLGTLLLKRADLLAVTGELVFRGEVALGLGHRQFPERAVEGAFHGVLKRAWVVGRQGIPFRIAPLIHVESVDMLAVHAPLLEEVDRPAVHAHGAYGQDERDGFLAVLGIGDLLGDLVAHHGVEVAEGFAGHRLEGFVPPGFPAGDRIGRT